MALLAALFSSLIFGVADFAGGYASRWVPVRMVVWASQVAGLVTVLVAAPLLGSETVAIADLAWGAGAGLAGMAALILFYDGLARGRMSVVSPLAGVTSIALPVVFGLLIGEQPTLVAALGILLAVPAVILISTVGESPPAFSALWRGGVLHGVAAGAGFAGFFILISRSGAESGMWPLVGARTTSVLVLGIVLLARREMRLPGRDRVGIVVGAGVADVVANALFLIAARGTLLILASAIVSLYPVSTLLLARYVTHERTTVVQRLGLALGAVAVVTIAAG